MTDNKLVYITGRHVDFFANLLAAHEINMAHGILQPKLQHGAVQQDKQDQQLYRKFYLQVLQPTPQKFICTIGVFKFYKDHSAVTK